MFFDCTITLAVTSGVISFVVALLSPVTHPDTKMITITNMKYFKLIVE